ncbi:MAG: cytochrome c biogenesis protein CcdA [Planctomycetota bacterium]|jgi:thiol:disulfide interchange protein
MKALNFALLLLFSISCGSLFAQEEATVTAEMPASATAGDEIELKLNFSIPMGYHAYHPDNPGLGQAPDIAFVDLAGLTKKTEVWPEPEKHTDMDGSEEWELNDEFTVTYTFEIPLDTYGAITIKGTHSTQWCDADGCLISEGPFSASTDILAAKISGPKLPEGDPPQIVAEAKFLSEAKAGGTAELEVVFGVTEHYHFYHKDNGKDADMSVGVPIGFLWPEVNGLKLVETIWPKPYRHVEDVDLDWVELELSHGATFKFIFEVPADAQGDLEITGGFKAQVCDANGCQDREGRFVASLKVRGKVEAVDPVPEAPKADLTPFNSGNGLTWLRDLAAASESSAKQQMPMLVLYTTDANATNRKFISVVDTTSVARAIGDGFVLFAIDSLADGQQAEAIAMAEALGPTPVLAVLNHDGREIAKFTPPANVLLLTETHVVEFIKSSIEELEDLNRDPRDAVDSHGFYLNFEYALEQAKAQGKQLLVDFNGRNCPPCRKMEKYVFTEPAVHKRMADFVIVSIQNDIKNKTYNDLWIKYQPHPGAAVPYYVVMDENGKALRGIGSTLPSDKTKPMNSEAPRFLEFLNAKGGELATEPANPEPTKEGLPEGWPKGLVGPTYPAVARGFDFEAKFSADEVKPGAKVSVELHFQLKELDAGPFNLYHKETQRGIPLLIDIKGSENLKLDGEWQYPEAEKYVEDWDDGDGPLPLLKLYGHVILVLTVDIPSDAKIGDTISIWGTASGQYCDNSGCVNFTDPLQSDFFRQFGWVATAVVSEDGVDSKVSAATSDPGKGGHSSDDKPEDEDNDSPLWFLLLAFLGGMVTLLTPCVLPVLPLTVGFFVSQNAKGKSPFFTALIYCGCIIGTFTLFGLITSLALGATGAQNISTNGYVNIFLGVLFAIFALSFLGMFELRMPMFMTSWFNKKQMGAAKEGKGYAKAFFSGSAFALISFSCTGPIAGAFLAGAAGGDFLMPTLAMLAFSLGMAGPIFLLGQFPALMKKMPKSGGWMNALKVVFGFIEIGLAVMYFSQAEQAFGSMAAAEWVNRYIVLAVWAACAFAIGIYLFGFFRMPHDHDETKQIGVVRAMIAVAFISFGIYMIPGMFGAKYGPYLEGILPLPPENGGIVLAMGSGEGEANDVHHLPWTKDLDEGLADAKAKNKPVFVDFTGYN